MLKRILFTFFLFIFFSRPVFAEDKFSLGYDIHYDVAKTGVTTVRENLTLTNLTSSYYAKEYRIKPGITDMTNIRAYDGKGPLQISKTENEVQVAFNDQIVGLNKQLKWSFIFDTNQIADNRGTVWEINLPRPGNEQNISSYTVTLNVDKSIGPAAYLNPFPDIGGVGEFGPFQWDRASLSKTGVLAGFGKSQIYDFNLKYHLVNSKLYPAILEIALPPQTNYQNVYINNINPKPDDVIVDLDGNWLAHFTLGPVQKLDVLIDGIADVYSYPINRLSESANNLTSSKKFWGADDVQIKTLAQTLITPEKIYDYVVTHLNYDSTRILKNLDRAGAKQVLNDPKSAICMEFTDLFVALARASGIPAREINGYAYTVDDSARPVQINNNPDILHAWPEYFDGVKWIMVDPTWENTTKGLDFFHQWDFNHFVFVRHGQNSVLPYPAGTYKINPQDKDVTINFGKSIPPKNLVPIVAQNKFSTTVFNPGPNVIEYQNQNLPPFAKRVKYADVSTPIIIITSVIALIITAAAGGLFILRRR